MTNAELLMMPKFKRRSFDGFEIARLECTDVVFPKHAHDEYVVGANITGREHIWLEGKQLEASVNDVTLYNPGEVQAASAKGGQWSFFSIYIDPGFVQDNFRSHTDLCFQRPVLSGGGFSDQIRGVCERSLHDEMDGHEVVEAVVALMECGLSGDGLAGKDRRRRRVCDPSRRTSTRLLETMFKPLTLPELALIEGLTPVQLVRRFTASYGVPPFRWLNIQRLKRARQLMRTDISLTELAVDLGFTDQAHFTRRFKAMYSVTPGEWLRSG